MRRIRVGNNADGTPKYEVLPDTQMPASGVLCARDEKGVPVAAAGRIQDAAAKAKPVAADNETTAAPSAPEPLTADQATPRRGRHPKE